MCERYDEWQHSGLQMIGGLGNQDSGGINGLGGYIMESPWDTPGEVRFIGINCVAINPAGAMMVSQDAYTTVTNSILGEQGARAFRFDVSSKYTAIDSHWIPVQDKLYITILTDASVPGGPFGTNKLFLLYTWRRPVVQATVLQSHYAALEATHKLAEEANLDESGLELGKWASRVKGIRAPWNPQVVRERPTRNPEMDKARRLAAGGAEERTLRLYKQSIRG